MYTTTAAAAYILTVRVGLILESGIQAPNPLRIAQSRGELIIFDLLAIVYSYKIFIFYFTLRSLFKVKDSLPT